MVSVTKLATSIEAYGVDVTLASKNGNVLIPSTYILYLELVEKWNMCWHKLLLSISYTKFAIRILPKSEYQWVISLNEWFFFNDI